MVDIFYYDNGIKKAELKELESIKSKQMWIDISNIRVEEEEQLKEVFDLHPLTIEDLQVTLTRVKVEEFPHYLFCVFYGLKKRKTIDLVELDFILGENFVISNHKFPIESFESLKNNSARLESLIKKGSDFIFHKLLDLEIDNFFPVLEDIDIQIEHLEEEITKRPRAELLDRILKLKRQVVVIKKISLPQREKISAIAKNEYPFISEKAIPYFRDVYDHSIKVSDSIENHRETISNTFEVYMSAINNNTNEVMKTLSVIATIALPLTVISSIYGTNFVNLPGAHVYFGFWVMVAAMLGVVSMMIFYFKRRGWF